jgi:ribosome-associated protein
MLRVTPAIAIDDSELEESFIRAGGPGGQNVNKVASAVQLRFDVRASPSLPEAVKARLAELAGARMTKDGVLVITAREHRDQGRNRAEARARLVALLRAAAKPRKTRRPTRTPAASRARRADAKTRRGTVKKLRARPAPEE